MKARPMAHEPMSSTLGDRHSQGNRVQGASHEWIPDGTDVLVEHATHASVYAIRARRDTRRDTRREVVLGLCN